MQQGLTGLGRELDVSAHMGEKFVDPPSSAWARQAALQPEGWQLAVAVAVLAAAAVPALRSAEPIPDQQQVGFHRQYRRRPRE